MNAKGETVARFALASRPKNHEKKASFVGCNSMLKQLGHMGLLRFKLTLPCSEPSSDLVNRLHSI